MTTPAAPAFNFAPPAGGGDWFTPKTHLGHLILIKAVTAVDPNHFDQLKNQGQGGTTTKVTFDYVDLDLPGAELVEGAANTHPGIASKLTQYAGTPQMVLGRIGQAPASQPGRSAAYILEDATGDPSATARAGAWLTAYQSKQFAAPTPPPAPAPAPVQVHVPLMAHTPVGNTNATPAVPGMDPATVQQLIDAGQDIAAIQAMAAILNPQPA